MAEQLICGVCEQPVGYYGRTLVSLQHVDIVADHKAVLRVPVPFPAGSKALYGVHECVVVAVHLDHRWIDISGIGGPFTVTARMLRPMPTKIAEPPVGQVVWDGDVPWQRGNAGWYAFPTGTHRVVRVWSDMPDTVVLATPPGGAS